MRSCEGNLVRLSDLQQESNISAPEESFPQGTDLLRYTAQLVSAENSLVIFLILTTFLKNEENVCKAGNSHQLREHHLP